MFKIFPIADLFDYDDENVKNESIHNPFVAYNAHHPTKFSNSKIKNNETVTGCATDFRNTAVMKKKASTQEKIKLVSDEGLGGLDASSKRPDEQKVTFGATENSNSSKNKKKSSAGRGI